MIHLFLNFRRLGLVLLVGLLAVSAPSEAQDRPYDPFRQGGQAPRSDDQPAPKDIESQVASGEFVNAPIGDVFRVVSDLTGWSIIMSPGVNTTNAKVNLWIKGMQPHEVLEQVVGLSGLVLHRKKEGVYQVMTFDEYAKLFGVKREVRQLKHIAAADVVKVVTPFIDAKGAAKVIASDAGNQVVLLVPEPLLAQLQQLIDAIDVPFQEDRIEIVRLEHLDAGAVAPLLEQFLTRSAGRQAGAATSKLVQQTAAQPGEAAAGGEGGAEGGKAGESLLVQFMVQPTLNAVVIRGLPVDVQRAVELLKNLDVAPGLEVISYQLLYTDAGEVRETLERLVERERSARGGQAGRMRFAVSEQNNRIVVEGSPEDQKRLASIIRAVDQPLPAGAGDIRVYRLENSTADEVAGVLQQMLEERDEDGPRASVESGAEAAPGAGPGGSGAAPPGGANGAGATAVPLTGVNAMPPRVTPAPEINAVIVRASSAEHDAVAQVVSQLDEPRDQVLIEVTLVTVSASDDFTLGVEVGGRIGVDATDIIGFSTFGIGAVDPATGAIRIADPAPIGANFGVFNSDDFSLVINALRTVGDIRISSAPKVLVEDNSPATISQVAEEPFEVLSQTESSTVTSFGGFVEAGTTLQVTPHISRDDWLRLEYNVNLSSFGERTAEQLAANLPPPRAVNNSEGIVRVPTGHVVVLGGLVSSRDSETLDAVPFLSDIPLLGELFKNRDNTKDQDTLYIFIRPIVLRDRGFRDLLLLSQADIEGAQVQDDGYPSNPMKLFGTPPDFGKAVTP